MIFDTHAHVLSADTERYPHSMLHQAGTVDARRVHRLDQPLDRKGHRRHRWPRPTAQHRVRIALGVRRQDVRVGVEDHAAGPVVRCLSGVSSSSIPVAAISRATVM